MASKRPRICPYCHARGITVEFETGNKLRQHVKSRHPKTATQKIIERKQLKTFRRQAIMALRGETT